MAWSDSFTGYIFDFTIHTIPDLYRGTCTACYMEMGFLDCRRLELPGLRGTYFLLPSLTKTQC